MTQQHVAMLEKQHFAERQAYTIALCINSSATVIMADKQTNGASPKAMVTQLTLMYCGSVSTRLPHHDLQIWIRNPGCEVARIPL